MDKLKDIMLYMPDGGEAGVIQAWFAKDRKWIEFRGDPYSKWRYSGELSPMQQVHDAMEGWHTTVLHQDAILALTKNHPDYQAVYDLMIKAMEPKE